MRSVVLASVLVFGTVVLCGSTPADADKDLTFVGVNKCKMCHKKEKSGNQFGIWSETAHAKAFETLASDKAKAEGAKQGIDDPQAAPECLKCHVTAFSVMDDLENQKITMEEGISCESCHGAGSGYYKKKTMAAIRAEELDGEPLGLVMPTEAVCVRCHNDESPFYKDFDFDGFAEKIAHPVPEAAAAAAETTE